MASFHQHSVTEALQKLEVNVFSGLTSGEAKKRSEQYGENRLEGGKEKTILQMMLEQLKDFLVIILMISPHFM